MFLPTICSAYNETLKLLLILSTLCINLIVGHLQTAPLINLVVDHLLFVTLFLVSFLVEPQCVRNNRCGESAPRINLVTGHLLLVPLFVTIEICVSISFESLMNLVTLRVTKILIKVISK
jgi:hypothetical protein